MSDFSPTSPVSVPRKIIGPALPSVTSHELPVTSSVPLDSTLDPDSQNRLSCPLESSSPSNQSSTPLRPKSIIGPTLPTVFEELPFTHPNHHTINHSTPSDLPQISPQKPSLNSPRISQPCPTHGLIITHQNDNTCQTKPYHSRDSSLPSSPLKRAEWMLQLPSSNDISSRLDPSKPRPTHFNSSRRLQAFKRAQANDSSAGRTTAKLWTETFDQRQKRLQNSILGIPDSPNTPSPSQSIPHSDSHVDAAAAARLHEANQLLFQNRGESLLNLHREAMLTSTKKKRKSTKPRYDRGDGCEDDQYNDDNPAKRPFNYNLDMRSSSRLSCTQRVQIMRNAANFSSKFSGGNYL